MAYLDKSIEADAVEHMFMAAAEARGIEFDGPQMDLIYDMIDMIQGKFDWFDDLVMSLEEQVKTTRNALNIMIESMAEYTEDGTEG